jgi:pyruvate-formate lyase-activating enzyme
MVMAGSGLRIHRGVSEREFDIILAIEIWDSMSMSFVDISRYSASVLFRRCQTDCTWCKAWMNTEGARHQVHRFAA